MEWITPKTDWYGETVNGVYSGDRFNAVDYNRIKNNLVYLHKYSEKLYDAFDSVSMGIDKAVGDFYYADEINAMENELQNIAANTIQKDYGTAPLYTPNGSVPNWSELNRLESAILDLYQNMTNQYNGRRTFTWNFGIPGGIV